MIGFVKISKNKICHPEPSAVQSCTFEMSKAPAIRELGPCPGSRFRIISQFSKIFMEGIMTLKYFTTLNSQLSTWRHQ